MQNALAEHHLQELNATRDAEGFREPPPSKKSKKSDEGTGGGDAGYSIIRVLPTDVLKKIFKKCPTSHRFIAPVCRQFRDLYGNVKSDKQQNSTSKYSINSFLALELYLDEARYYRKAHPDGRRREASRIGAGAGRIDWVEERDMRDWGTCEAAARGGRPRVLAWLRARGCCWDEWTCAAAAAGGQLDTLRWLKARGCPWNEKTCSRAAAGGHEEVLAWARGRGCPWDAKTCRDAATGGHLEVLQWARANGCAWDLRTSLRAATEGHLGVLRWAIENHCPHDECFFQSITDEAFHEWYEEHKRAQVRDEI